MCSQNKGLCVAALSLAWRAYMGPFKWIDWASHFITFNQVTRVGVFHLLVSLA